MAVASQRADGFEAFARLTTPRLFNTALFLCGGDWHLAEDMVQTTLGKTFVAWKKVCGAENPQAYVRSVLMRTYLSHRRLRRTQERPVAELPEQGCVEGDPSVRIALMGALGQLAPKDRAVVVLRYWEDRSVTETAAELGMSAGSVRNRSMRGLAALRKLLNSDHDVFSGR